MQKIGFIYTNKSYSVYHSLGIAIVLAELDKYDIHILCTQSNQALILEYLERFNAKQIKVKILRPYWYFTLPHYFEIKFQLRPTLMHKYSKLLNTFDAFVCTMYEDLYLKKVIKKNRDVSYIFSNHGISNRAYSFDDRITQFNLFFLLDKKAKSIRQSLNQLKPNNHAMTGFVKYDLIKNLPLPSLFNNDNPVVIYNPHWINQFTSFHKFGKQLLEGFANNKAYNLIFAPHSLLLARNWKLKSVYDKYSKFDNIIVDSSSELCNNMTYTRIADIYIGDISSQVFEFLYEGPKPCLFLDAHNLQYDEKDRPLSWDLGDVYTDIISNDQLLDDAVDQHNSKYLNIQKTRLKEMFDVGSKSPTEIGAEAIDNYLSNKENVLKEYQSK